MEYKPLFTVSGHYRNEAHDLDHEVMKAIQPFFTRGFCPRQVYALICAAATSEMASTMIMDAVNERKAKAALKAEQLPEG